MILKQYDTVINGVQYSVKLTDHFIEGPTSRAVFELTATKESSLWWPKTFHHVIDVDRGPVMVEWEFVMKMLQQIRKDAETKVYHPWTPSDDSLTTHGQ